MFRNLRFTLLLFCPLLFIACTIQVTSPDVEPVEIQATATSLAGIPTATATQLPTASPTSLSSRSDTTEAVAVNRTFTETQAVSQTVTLMDSVVLTTSQSSSDVVPTVSLTKTETITNGTPIATATFTPIPEPQVVADQNNMNIRSGPGVAYPVIAGLSQDDSAPIIGVNPAGDWWQIRLPNVQVGWIYASLVAVVGDIEQVIVVTNIPTPPPPTATPVPPPISIVKTQPQSVEQAAVESDIPDADTPVASIDGPDFRVLKQRLWNVIENEGRFHGDAVVCGFRHEMTVEVFDIHGNRLNGVAVQGIYSKEIIHTGSQGKGDGNAEFILWSGEDVKILRDADGREVTSEVAVGQTTRTADIPFDQLIQAQYCKDEADCQKFVDLPGCWGHFSWTVTFQRQY